ncbi:MAG: patatin-like phospholipase family protein [Bacteroidetes bacterium]|nr:patatin-like phospholipase family protein [Bacteroidota bacterium]
MNALVISGGGSKGAFAGGVAEYLIKDCKKDYALFVGTSTGSLLAPFLALGDIERIKKIYSTIKHEDIFTTSPFVFHVKNGIIHTRINHWGIIRQFFRKQKTFGNSENLRTLIKKSFTSENFKQLRVLQKEVIVTVANLTTRTTEYKSSLDYNYTDFCDWIWASANFIPFMSLLTKNGSDYGDGGFGNLIPVQQALNKGASVIDVIVLNPENIIYRNVQLHNVFDVVTQTFDFMLSQIATDDLLIAKLESTNLAIEIHFYYTHRILTEQAYIFDASQMKQWWKEGYELFKNQKPKSHYLKPTE